MGNLPHPVYRWVSAIYPQSGQHFAGTGQHTDRFPPYYRDMGTSLIQLSAVIAAVVWMWSLRRRAIKAERKAAVLLQIGRPC